MDRGAYRVAPARPASHARHRRHALDQEGGTPPTLPSLHFVATAHVVAVTTCGLRNLSSMTAEDGYAATDATKVISPEGHRAEAMWADILQD